MACPDTDRTQYSNLGDPEALRIVRLKGGSPPCRMRIYCKKDNQPIPYTTADKQPKCPASVPIQTPLPSSNARPPLMQTETIAPFVCTKSTEDYECNTGIADKYSIGEKVILPTWQACKDLCQGTAACQAWTFGPDRGCVMKKDNVTRAQKGYTSGGRVKSCTKPDNDAYSCDRRIPSEYHIGAPFKKSTWQDCRDSCSADPKCMAWTYTPDGNCIKASSDEMAHMPGFKSGRLDRDSGNGGGGSNANTTTTTTTTSAPSSPTGDSSSSWWSQTSPLGLQWGMVVALGVLIVLVILCVSSGAMMMMMR